MEVVYPVHMICYLYAICKLTLGLSIKGLNLLLSGQLINLQTGRSVRVAGTFHFREPWWQTTILRTKKTRDKHIEPKDYFALCYRLRDDLKTKIDHLADMFISKVGETDIKVLDGKKLEVTSWFESARRDFEAFLR